MMTDEKTEVMKLEKQLLKKIEKSKKLSWSTIKSAFILDGLMHSN